MKRLLSFLFLISPMMIIAQGLINPSEKILYSFNTDNKKKVVLALDTLTNTMIYRFGTEAKTELEIKDNLDDTIRVFTYNFYMRGGGAENSALDLNYIVFENNGFEYRLYDEYSAEDNSSEIGIRVMDLQTNAVTEMKGEEKSKRNSLVDFRFTGLVPVIE
jgi:hypothetical protein